jgi:ATP-binding cassette subfamily B protein
MRGDIVFDDVHFAYPGSPEILRGLSMTIPGGKTVGILGGTGSGKSTLTYLLARLYDLPEGGGTRHGGRRRPARHAALLRAPERRAGAAGHVFVLPHAEARTSRPATRNYDMAAIRGAAAAADLDETIEPFPEGYDTLVGERGVTLSGGQRQRMAIARMLMEHTPIQVFDDSLSAVDAETDAKIRAALREKTAGTTTVLISAPDLDDPARGPHLRPAGRPRGRAGHARGAARAGRHLPARLRAAERAETEGGEANA